MRRLGSVDAVTFDVGGTLIEPWPSVGHVYAAVAEQFGLRGVAAESLSGQFARAWRGRAAFDYSHASWQKIVNETFAGLAPALPSAECFAAIHQQFGRAGSWRVYEDVVPALSRLKSQGLKLGIISNWDERLRPLLEELNLSAWFDAIVASHDLARPKPAVELFTRAAALLGTSPGSMLHVGDSAAEDVEGARAAGMRAVLLERGNGPAPGRGGGHARIRTLADISDGRSLGRLC